MKNENVTVRLIVIIIFLSILVLVLLANQNYKLWELIENEKEPVVGDAAFLFAKTAIFGEKVNINGQTIFLIFFNIDCPVCSDAFQIIMEKYNDLISKGVQIVGITKNSSMQLKSYISKYQIKFPIIIDKSGKLFWKYKIHSVPLFVIINRFGKICFYQHYGLKLNDALSQISECLK